MRAWLGYRRLRLLLDLQISRDLAEDSGLSDADYDVLSNLSEAEGHRLRLRDLAAHMRWSTSRLSHHLTRMQRRGLIERRECDEDGRGALIVLTDAGRRAIEAAAPGHVEAVRSLFFDGLTGDQVQMLEELATQVLNRLEPAG